ncbi:RsmE family RNA methyltransferase [Planctomicrobium sp. SH668]|uniref:RsmE family RNA methyltransferase n=1 Tax=Planctomicrobium sp. SH668 TaxID=3448126 RepID=UPI003F5B7A9A
MSERFYAPGTWSETVTLEGPEAHHLSRVMRAEAGDQISIFDGEGRSCVAAIENVRRNEVVVRLVGSPSILPAQEPAIVIAVASPKGERLSWMIEKVTELGCDRLIPLITERSVVKPSDHKINKAEQTVIAACKQSGRDRVLKIDETCALTKLPDRINLQDACLLVGAPDGNSIATITEENLYKRKQIVVVIGPEGGLSPAEEDLLKSWSAQRIALSPHILRVETAAIAFATWLCADRLGKLPVES